MAIHKVRRLMSGLLAKQVPTYIIKYLCDVPYEEEFSFSEQEKTVPDQIS